jgi:hypothetical protein
VRVTVQQEAVSHRREMVYSGDLHTRLRGSSRFQNTVTRASTQVTGLTRLNAYL